MEPQINADERRLNEITEKIIGCAYAVSNALGCGYLEKVYENALRGDLVRDGMKVLQQYPVPVFYKGEQVGDYVADLLVEDCVLVELKACKSLDEIHSAQCLNYLKATGFKVCLLINFGNTKVQIRRLVHQY
jgi:GxxExxY protein